MRKAKQKRAGEALLEHRARKWESVLRGKMPTVKSLKHRADPKDPVSEKVQSPWANKQMLPSGAPQHFVSLALAIISQRGETPGAVNMNEITYR
jgi:hypothetical protein